jgi:hypothetical protein
MKLIYIAYGNVSVFDSQVVALLNCFIESDQVSEIVLVLGTDYKGVFNDKKIKNLNQRVKIEYYKQYPQYILIESLTVNSITRALKGIENMNDYVIHVRNDVTAHYAYKAIKRLKGKTNRIIADVRGAGLEQLIEFSAKNKFVLWLKKIQRNQVNKSLSKIKNLSVVSQSLKKYVYDKVGGDINVRVNSCLANRDFKFDEKVRSKLREELNVANDESLLVLSTGGDNAWQNTKQTIATLTDKNFKILNLSRTQIPHPNVITKFVPYSEMFKYLCAADASIIFRNKGVTNQVASPVKFSEYVSCGLPVLTNDSVDLITDYVKNNSCGKILTSLDLINSNILDEMKSLDRNVIARKGQIDFGIDTIASQYVDFYKSV